MADPKLLRQRPLLMFGRTRDDRERWNQASPGLTKSEGFLASFERSKMDTATSSLMRMKERSDLEEQARLNEEEILEPEELNKRFEGRLMQPLTEPMPMSVAEFVAERHENMARLDSAISKTPDGVFSGIANFGGAMSAFVTDPVELAADIGIGMATGGVGTVLKKFAQGARVARLMSKSGELSGAARLVDAGLSGAQGTGKALETMGRAFTRGNTFKANVGRGLAVGVGSEGLAQHVYSQDQIDRSAWESFMSVSAGTVGFAAVGAMGRKIVSRMTAKQNAEAIRIAENQAAHDRKLSTEMLQEELNARPYGDVPGEFQYKFNQNREEALKGKVFVTSKDGAFKHTADPGDLRVGSRGVIASDDFRQANSAGARPGEAPDYVVQVDVTDAKMYDLEGTLGDAENQAFKKAIADSGFMAKVEGNPKAKSLTKKEVKALNKIVDESASARDVFEKVDDAIADGKLDDSAFDLMETALEDMGFDGISYTNYGKKLRSPGEPRPELDINKASNTFKIFNPQKLKSGKKGLAKSEFTGKAHTREDLQRIAEENNSVKNAESYDPELEANRKPASHPEDDGVNAKEMAEREEQIKESISEDIVDELPEDTRKIARAFIKEHVKRYDDLSRYADDIEPAIQNAASCLGGGRGK